MVASLVGVHHIAMTDSDDIIIRLLGPNDAPLLNNVIPDVFDDAIIDARAAEFLADPRHHLAVAIADGAIVGMASAVHYIHPDKEPELWINEVGVADEFRRRGIAKRLLDALFAHARTLGCGEAWVLTDADNTAALSLYRAAKGQRSDQVLFAFDLDR